VIYRHSSGIFLRQIKKRKSNVNTYLIVDELNIPILKKVEGFNRMDEQHRIVTGFDNLIEIDTN